MVSQDVSLTARVLATIVYSQVFKYPLTLTEVWHRTWGARVPMGAVARALAELQELGLVESAQNWFWLKGQAQTRVDRRHRADQSQAKIEDTHQSLAPRLRWIPWLKAVGITGSVAAANADESDDIDFIMICQPHRLWLVRALVWLATAGSGRRRPWHADHSGATVKDQWCFNLWLTTDHLTILAADRSIYTAYEVMQVQWLKLHHDDGFQPTWLSANRWAEPYMPQWYAVLNSTSSVKSSRFVLTQVVEEIFSPVLSGLNYLSYLLQRWYMRSHMTTEKVSLESAFFHPRQTQLWLWARWVQLLSQTAGLNLVLATGVFDLLHAEHRRFVAKAAAAGDILVLGIESDARVRQLKGPDRPKQPQSVRQLQLRQLPEPDFVWVLPDSFDSLEVRRRFIQSLRPNTLALSAHSPHLDEKTALMHEINGVVKVVLPHNQAVSTTQILANQS